ncbi:MAG TPA: helix-turn-helix domain-containing protein [Solirubrobacteraceae bacterium]|nr:helix-turn-helix domain-containing protein [Solirubrobacteraceae bacterium]
MPRPKTVDDDAVLAAAMRVIDRGGPAKLTLEAVAREVGLSPATLVQRFRSKRGLLLAVAGRGSGSAGDALRDAARRHRSPLRALAAGLVSMSSSVSSPEVLANQLAFLQIDLSDPEFHALALEHTRAVRAEINALLDSAVEAGELPPTDTPRLAQAVQTTYNGALITWAIYRQGRLETWLRRELDALLEPYRSA